MTTLSFPFTVTTSSSNTSTAATLNILPISGSHHPLPTITTTSADFDTNDVLTTIPVSLSIQHSPTIQKLNNIDSGIGGSVVITGSSGESVGGGTVAASNMLLTVKPLNGIPANIGGNNFDSTENANIDTSKGQNSSVSRNNSFNTNLNLSLTPDSYIMKRTQSLRSESTVSKVGENELDTGSINQEPIANANANANVLNNSTNVPNVKKQQLRTKRHRFTNEKITKNGQTIANNNINNNNNNNLITNTTTTTIATDTATATAPSTTATATTTIANNNSNNIVNNINKKTNNLIIKSAPSTLAKRPPTADIKTGEVYV